MQGKKRENGSIILSWNIINKKLFFCIWCYPNFFYLIFYKVKSMQITSAPVSHFFTLGCRECWKTCVLPCCSKGFLFFFALCAAFFSRFCKLLVLKVCSQNKLSVWFFPDACFCGFSAFSLCLSFCLPSNYLFFYELSQDAVCIFFKQFMRLLQVCYFSSGKVQ